MISVVSDSYKLFESRVVIFSALFASLREIYEAISAFHDKIKVFNHAEPQSSQSYCSTNLIHIYYLGVICVSFSRSA